MTSYLWNVEYIYSDENIPKRSSGPNSFVAPDLDNLLQLVKTHIAELPFKFVEITKISRDEQVIIARSAAARV
jgi:hypothetical protein